MIHFIHNIDQTERERYLESGKVTCIQRKKAQVGKSKDSKLPVLEVILLFPVILFLLLIGI